MLLQTAPRPWVIAVAQPSERQPKLRLTWLACTRSSKSLGYTTVVRGLVDQVGVPQHRDVEIQLTEHGPSLDRPRF